MIEQKWLWIGGGALLLVLLLASHSSAGGTIAQQSAPTADTSAQDIAETQGKYGLASALVNAGGTLDLLKAQNAGQAGHDDASIRGIVADYNGQAYLADRQYAGQGLLAGIIGSINTGLARIQAKNNVDLAGIDKDKALGLAGIDSTTQLGLGQQATDRAGILTQGAVSIEQIHAQQQGVSDAYSYMLAQSNNQTAQNINETQQKQQTKRTAWQTFGQVVGAGATLAAWFL